eukprot:gnl/Dysnectes_brevis/2978_a3669_1501.p1 GENE.gnl/Dysnectes_brevis/2978_a3669_1501~~gnl/Dysnectes_brevis/2978_a3669_1501.p1  ORF type:complete len:221 (+),score=35.95 gnl/Dysnectes_brevis/2978_a3669_1501:28-663(+)
MPIWYQSLHDPTYSIFIGFDKFENEDLIKHHWETDIWFHVDKHSSAHVYLRLHEGDKLSKVPAEIIEECAQLTKQNSIEGCKLKNVTIIYTRASNLLKTGDMKVGAVSFHSRKKIKRVVVAEKNRVMLKALEKHRREDRTTDLGVAKRQHEKEIRAKKKALRRAAESEARIAREAARAEKQRRDYNLMWDDDALEFNDEVSGPDPFDGGFM